MCTYCGIPPAGELRTVIGICYATVTVRHILCPLADVSISPSVALLILSPLNVTAILKVQGKKEIKIFKIVKY